MLSFFEKIPQKLVWVFIGNQLTGHLVNIYPVTFEAHGNNLGSNLVSPTFKSTKSVKWRIIFPYSGVLKNVPYLQLLTAHQSYHSLTIKRSIKCSQTDLIETRLSVYDTNIYQNKKNWPDFYECYRFI